MRIRTYHACGFLLCFTVLVAMTPGDSLARNSIEGGSGLLRMEDAWSLPVSGLLFGVYGGYYDNNFTPGTSRLISMTPSFTKGLGRGFEVSGAWPIEGLTSGLSGDRFGRRFDFRLRDPILKGRWTRFVGDPRLRAGVSGSLVLPIEDKTRPGGVEKPANAFDYGMRGLLSADLGSLRAPVRVHVNSGYWWSRDDRAFFYRGLPRALPFLVEGDQLNDVFDLGLGVEAGFTRFNVFAELTTQQLWDARSQIKGSENYWRLTPGVRTELTSTIGLTAALSFDLSRDSDKTTFDPAEVYPDVELQVGLTMGQVLDRVRRARRVASVDPTLAADVLAVPAAPPVAQSLQQTLTNSPTPAEVGLATSAAPPEAPKTPLAQPLLETAGAAPPLIMEPTAGAAVEQRLQEVLQRLSHVETTVRLGAIESRIAMLEGSPTAEPALRQRSSQTAPEQPNRTIPQSTGESVSDAGRDVQPTSSKALTPAIERPAAASLGDSAVSQLGLESVARDERIDALSVNVDQLRAAVQALADVQPPAPSRPTLASPVLAPSVEKAATTLVEPLPASTPGSEQMTVASTTPTTQAAASRESAMQAEIQRLQQQIDTLSRHATGVEPRASTSVVLPPAQSAVPWVQQSIVLPSAPIQQPQAPSESPRFDTSVGSGASITERLRLETQREIENSRTLRGEAAPADSQAVQGRIVAANASISDAAQQSTSGSSATPSPIVTKSVASLQVGQARTLAEIDGTASDGMPTVLKSVIEELALDLSAQPTARIMLVVHGGSADHAEALQVSEATATSIRRTLIDAGARPEQIVALGLGLSEIGNASRVQNIEIQRLQ